MSTRFQIHSCTKGLTNNPIVISALALSIILMAAMIEPLQAQILLPPGVVVQPPRQQVVPPQLSIRNQLIKNLSEWPKNSDGIKTLLESQLIRFENRMNKSGGQQQVMKCLSIISCAFDGYKKNGDVTGAMLCRHLIIELADQSEVNQGNHNTCALAALQSLLYSDEPELVCNLVIQAHTGRIRLPDGRIIELPANNIAPDLESRYFRSKTAYRSYAAQLFQVAAANIYWQSQTKDANGNNVPLGSMSYVQDYPGERFSSKDSRERVIIRWSSSVTELMCGDDCMPSSSPNFTFKSIVETYRLLGGQKKSHFLLSRDHQFKTKATLFFSNESELARILQRLQEEDALPAIISVSGSKLFAAVPRLRPANGNLEQFIYHGKHVVCINSYDRISNQVSVHNFWGPEGNDHMSLHDLVQLSQ